VSDLLCAKQCVNDLSLKLVGAKSATFSCDIQETKKLRSDVLENN